MTRNKVQRLLFPTPVFQKLTGKFDGVPRHAVYSRNPRHRHFSQHVVDTMTKFVEQRNNFIMGGSKAPMDLFVAFRGREPQVDALLRHSGIKG